MAVANWKSATLFQFCLLDFLQAMVMSDPRILAELFTSTHLQQLAWYGSSESLSASVDLLEREGSVSQGSPVADVLDDAFRMLFREHPIEYVYKACVLKRKLFGTYSPNTTALYMEFPVAGARADILLVNGDAKVFEVKTRFDDTTRLNIQLAEYYRCFRSCECRCGGRPIRALHSGASRPRRHLGADPPGSRLASGGHLGKHPRSSIMPRCSRYYAKENIMEQFPILV